MKKIKVKYFRLCLLRGRHCHCPHLFIILRANSTSELLVISTCETTIPVSRLWIKLTQTFRFCKLGHNYTVLLQCVNPWMSFPWEYLNLKCGLNSNKVGKSSLVATHLALRSQKQNAQHHHDAWNGHSTLAPLAVLRMAFLSCNTLFSISLHHFFF